MVCKGLKGAGGSIACTSAQPVANIVATTIRMQTAVILGAMAVMGAGSAPAPDVDRAPLVDRVRADGYPPRSEREPCAMKVRSSLKSLKNRHKDCKVVRRKGRVYVINKTQPRFKARQG